MELAALAERIAQAPAQGKRRLVAVAGPPGSGKSTLAHKLGALVPDSRVVPMDGFHLDNRLLDEDGRLARKGSPETFDAAGFAHLIHRLGREDRVVYPVFDRALDKSIAGAERVTEETRTVIVEGNYLLLDTPDWEGLRSLWDLTVFLDEPEEVLRARLLQRWRDHGFSEEAALAKAEGNDLPNARTVRARSYPADVVVRG